MNRDSIIFVSGKETLEGLSLIQFLFDSGFTNVITESTEEDLEKTFKNEKPEYVFLLGEISGGIQANIKKPATLMRRNLNKMITIIDLSLKHNVNKLLFLASSCIYPRDSNKKLSPDMIMTGSLEPTNSGYATAKLTGLELIKSIRKEFSKNFISSISANVFGPFDDFASEDAHVISSLIRKVKATKDSNKKELLVWGTGEPIRDFIFSEDLADGLVFLMNNYNGDIPINISTGRGSSIKELTEKIVGVSDYTGRIKFDTTKPDGMPYKVLDNKEITRLGWTPKTEFNDALKQTYDWYIDNS
jgi:GDP-L-fucose synthase